MIKRYKVEFTEQENNYCYTGGWDDVIIAAESEEEAIELAKDWINENMVSYPYESMVRYPYEIEDGKIIFPGLESEKYIYRVKDRI